MNEFTKKELENLSVMLQRVQKYCYSYEFDIICSLSEKLQSLIDNYCEHDYSESLVKFDEGWFRACNICGIKK